MQQYTICKFTILLYLTIHENNNFKCFDKKDKYSKFELGIDLEN